MALVNHDTKEVQFKIVYCGPAFSGKTTNLQHIHGRIDDDRRGDLLSMATSTDRTVFFDYLPIDAVLIKGYHTKFQLYTVPGQVAYNATRQLVLRGADGLVFVADSSPQKMGENVQALASTEENLSRNGVTLAELPFVFQFNKRDLPDAVPVEVLQRELNGSAAPFPVVEAVASQGYNVFATLNAVAEEVLQRFHATTAGAGTAAGVAVG
jgi:signal recognition particle receptor subunit beta